MFLFVFLDGVGLGPATSDNPFATLDLPAFAALASGQRWTADARPVREPGHVFHRIDANLGVEGLPQSGTGQASLFTGENCAALAGRHFGPYPHSTSKPLIAARNVFHVTAQASGRPVTFANAYPERFFSFAKKRGRWTVTTLCCLEAAVSIRGPEALALGRALPANLTGEGWPQDGDPHLPITEAEAARRFLALGEQHAFTLFEYYLTDKAGHSRDPARATAVLRSLDRFFATLLTALPVHATLVVTSDHGNIEDLGVKTHTRHPVPLVALGPAAPAFADVADLTGVLPALEQGRGARS